MSGSKFRVVILKPSKYAVDGYVDRFRRGFMPNSTIVYMRSMTPDVFEGTSIETHSIDEYVETDLNYLRLLDGSVPTLLALVGVQSHQFHRALDLASYAISRNVRHCVIGGPHVMTCDTSMLQNRGVSFALAEAEIVWPQILHDALHGGLEPVYGGDHRWQRVLDAPVLKPPSTRDLHRHVVPMLGIYPSRGCPFTCNFCSVIKIAGHRIRSQQLATTMASLHAAKAGGVKYIMFTSDNFNKYPEARELLNLMIEERIRLPFFVQCDAQIADQEEFVALMARAGCFQIFVGVESFNRKTLLAAHKAQNHPERYASIVRMCRRYAIATHFSNIIGFPDDEDRSIRETVENLREMWPDCASFYILTPIPGTQQYDEFRRAGWITEANLDRYDATSPTWRHPRLEPGELKSLLFACYRRFYSSRQILMTVTHALKPRFIWPGIVPYVGVPIFTRYFVRRGMHPMSGGVGRMKLDHVSNYAALRRSRYGYDLVPLPASLELSESDAAFNQAGKLG